MLGKRRGPVHLAFVLAITLPAPSQAEPLLLSGRIQYQWNEAGFLELAAPSFYVIGEFGSYTGHRPPGICDECRPGERFNPGGVEHFLGATFGFAEFRYRGTNYEFTAGEATFSAPSLSVPAIPHDGSFGSVDAPFTVRGYFEGTSRIGERVRVDLAGRGTVGIDFDFERGGWFSSYYNFEQSAPVPEPATLLLLGGAVTGSLLCRRFSRFK